MKNIFILFIFIIATNLAFAQIPTNGLVGYWPMSGNADDLSGNNLHLTGNASLTTDRFGNIQKAYSFNGSNQYLYILDNSILDFGTGDFSISVWIKISSLPGTWKSIINKGASGSIGYGVEISSTNKITSSIEAYNGTNQHSYSEQPALNEWIHVVAVYDRDQYIYTYINGVLEKTDSYLSGNTNTIDNYYNFNVGRFNSGSWYFNGSIDDIRIYNRVLTSSEISELYNEVSVKVIYTYDGAGNRNSQTYQAVGFLKSAGIENYKNNGYEPLTDDDILLYPNPTEGTIQIFVKQEEVENVMFYLYDMNGVLVKQEKFVGFRQEIDLTDHVSGNYFLKIVIGDKVVTRKIIKK